MLICYHADKCIHSDRYCDCVSAHAASTDSVIVRWTDGEIAFLEVGGG